jgi:hypothetical protein
MLSSVREPMHLSQGSICDERQECRTDQAACFGGLRLKPAARTHSIVRDAWISHGVRDHESVPHEEHNGGSQRCADQSRALVKAIPSHLLPEIRGDKRARDAQKRRQDETGRIVRTRQQIARDDAGDKADEAGYPSGLLGFPQGGRQLTLEQIEKVILVGPDLDEDDVIKAGIHEALDGFKVRLR